MVYPRACNSNLIRKYTLVVSLCSKLHHKSSCFFGSLATTEHHEVCSRRSPQYVASTTKFTSRGRCCFLGGRYAFRRSRRTLLSLPYSSLSSRSVCLLKTYSPQSSFSKVVFSLPVLRKNVRQSLQKYFCLPSCLPSFVTLVDWQFGHFLAFF